MRNGQTDGSTRIDAAERVCLGGVEQWISLRSENVANPILLFLHGGPGTAQIFWSRKSQRPLEKDFLVVNWDQRGAGRSYHPRLDQADMTIARFVADCEELIEILLRRFKQEKIFLVGHSWGSIVGIELAARRPDLLRAYIGIGQVVNMQKGEDLSYIFTLDEARRRNNQKAIRQLEAIGHPPYKDMRASGIQRDWLSKFNGATYTGSLMGKMLDNVSLRDLRPGDIVKFVRGAIFSLSTLEDEQMSVDFSKTITELKVPVYFCCGRRDYNVPFELVADYCEKLIAPSKRMVWFERSGHVPNFEEPEKFCETCSNIKAEVLSSRTAV